MVKYSKRIDVTVDNSNPRREVISRSEDENGWWKENKGYWILAKVLNEFRI